MINDEQKENEKEKEKIMQLGHAESTGGMDFFLFYKYWFAYCGYKK